MRRDPPSIQSMPGAAPPATRLALVSISKLLPVSLLPTKAALALGALLTSAAEARPATASSVVSRRGLCVVMFPPGTTAQDLRRPPHDGPAARRSTPWSRRGLSVGD